MTRQSSRTEENVSLKNGKQDKQDPLTEQIRKHNKREEENRRVRNKLKQLSKKNKHTEDQMRQKKTKENEVD